MIYCTINFVISFLHAGINFNSRLCLKYSYFSNFTVNYLYLFSSCVYLLFFYYFLCHYLMFMLFLFRCSTLVNFVLMLSYTTRFVDKNDHSESSRSIFQLAGPKKVRLIY